MKTLLVTLLLLVVGTSTTFAECAWVLWEAAGVRDNHAGGSSRGVRDPERVPRPDGPPRPGD